MNPINSIVLTIFATGNVQALFFNGGGDMGNWVNEFINNGMQGGNWNTGGGDYWNGGNKGNYWQNGNQNQQSNYWPSKRPGNNNNGNYPGQNNNQNQYPGGNQNQGQYPESNQNQGQQPQYPGSNQNQEQQAQYPGGDQGQEEQPQQSQQSQQPQQPNQNQNQSQSSSGGQCSAPASNNDPCSKSSAQSQAQFGSPMNQPYPSGQCTEWADARYKELFGVNGQLNGDARLWVSDAKRKGGYQVSAQPSVGAMVVTQPGVLGAGSTGHVGIVEKVYQSGDVCVSNWNYPTPWKTTYIKQKGQASGVDYIQKNGVQLKC